MESLGGTLSETQESIREIGHSTEAGDVDNGIAEAHHPSSLWLTAGFCFPLPQHWFDRQHHGLRERKLLYGENKQCPPQYASLRAE